MDWVEGFTAGMAMGSALTLFITYVFIPWVRDRAVTHRRRDR